MAKVGVHVCYSNGNQQPSVVEPKMGGTNMNGKVSRRKCIKLAAVTGGAAIVGFDLRARSWVTQAQAQTQSFSDVTKLDGVLLFDETTRKALADDRGHLVHKIPTVVLRPKSV